MNLEGRIEQLETRMEKPSIKSWVDYMNWLRDGTSPAVFTPEMTELMELAKT